MNTELEDNSRAATLEPPMKTTPKVPGNMGWDDEEPEKSAFKKYRLPVFCGIVLACGIGYVANSMSKHTAAPPPKQETTIVRIVAPPPPPPPVPPPPQQLEEKKVDMVEEVKQEEAPPEPAPQVQTALVGKGDGGMQLAKGNGSGIFANRNNVSAERLRWSAYAGLVKSRIGQALESNPKTRKARMQIVVRVWLDETGRIARARLDGSTSDSAMDAAIRDEILPGLQVSEPPPLGMPMPINMRVTAQRRN